MNRLPACPGCGCHALLVELRLEARHAHPDVPRTVTAPWPWVRCTACGVEARGRDRRPATKATQP